jgi:anaerobic selenocysteine-containing dehydrogenase
MSRICLVPRPAGTGRLGPKDQLVWQDHNSPDRLTKPLIRRNGELVETDWVTAMDAVAGRCLQLLDERGPGSIAFYTTGQLLLEEYCTLGLIAH